MKYFTKKMCIFFVIIIFILFLSKSKTKNNDKILKYNLVSYTSTQDDIIFLPNIKSKNSSILDDIVFLPSIKSKNYTVLILCLSRSNEFDLRNIIRNTTYSECISPKCGYMFVIGSSNDSNINILLRKEANTYNDIFLTKQIDSYGIVMTTKLHTLYKWLNWYIDENKINVSWFIKTDSDVFTIISSAIAYIDKFKEGDLYGVVYKKGAKVIRNIKNKNMETKPIKDEMYPAFPSGTLYYFNNKVLRIISKNLTIYNNEDTTMGLWLHNTSAVMIALKYVKKNICTLIDKCSGNEKCFSIHSLSHHSDVFFYKKGFNFPSNYKKIWYNYKKCNNLLVCDGVCYFS